MNKSDSIATKFQIHYFFADNSHSMNALVKNRCEAEVLHILKEVGSVLGVTYNIDSEPLQEGGLVEVWNFAGNNFNQISIILVVIGLYFSRKPPSNKELDDLKKEDLKLSLDERNLRLHLMRRQLKKMNTLEPNNVEKAVEIINQHIKATKRKSNFYEQLIGYPKVKKVSFSAIDNNNDTVGTEEVVERNEFIQFVLKDNDLPTEVIENAIIQIVSPVLEKRNYKWKGIFDNKVISFAMLDNKFKQSVLQKEVLFKRGSYIEAVLEIERKINNLGEIDISGYSVRTVMSYSDNIETVFTEQGKKYINRKEHEQRQMRLF